MNSTTAVIVQARSSSMRLPKKVLADLSGRPLIEFLVERLRCSKEASEIILATTDSALDDELADIGRRLGLKVVRGSEQDVLSRYYEASLLTESSNLVRVTADCPFVDPKLLDKLIHEFNSGGFDYFSNVDPPTFPDGLDLEIFSKDALRLAYQNCNDPSGREHVTTWIRNHADFAKGNLAYEQDYSYLRLTVDEPEDLELVEAIIKHFNGSSSFSLEDILDLYLNDPDLFQLNAKHERNQGKKLPAGQKLWRRAKRVIPGGNMLLSKRPELFLPNHWPVYFSKSKGCHVWDLDNKQYIDMSLMSVGTNILGYSNSFVDSAVCDVIHKGTMSTLNCPEEVELAEKLVSIHPWADMVRFARSGGEANAISIRIARAATGRETIAVCGYHGWHDWYLATNLGDNSGLSEHLLPGLEPNGVPSCLKGSVQPFSYNNIEQLKRIIHHHKLAAVKMEVERTNPPRDGFLSDVRKLCDEHNIVLIFDECTSGFRETFGGLHLKYNVNPDMAMFGKALGNGYAITSVIGRKEIMEAAQKTFISSTFWTERIGPTAALSTLKFMQEHEVWKLITQKGKLLKKSWNDLSLRHSLPIIQSGIPALATYTFANSLALYYKTYVTQEMLKKGFLASSSCFLSISHSSDIIDSYLNALDDVFSTLPTVEDEEHIKQLLDGPTAHTTFKRLN